MADNIVSTFGTRVPFHNFLWRSILTETILQEDHTMERKAITREAAVAFERYLHEEELSEGTTQKYRRDLEAFVVWVGDRLVTKELAAGWKEQLLQHGYAPTTINSMLAAINQFFKFMGWQDCTVKFLKIQRKLFRDRSRELTEREFRQLVDAAERNGQRRLAVLLETIASTGIRVSEVKYITVAAVHRGRAEISLKGKIRTILLPTKLCRKLLKYAAKSGIASGEIFLTGSGKSLNRKQIWAEMKQLCRAAGVEASKVFPHNLRHLFATVFYRMTRDIAKLADVLGHSSVETTRIYLTSTGDEHLRQLDRLGFIR